MMYASLGMPAFSMNNTYAPLSGMGFNPLVRDLMGNNQDFLSAIIAQDARSRGMSDDFVNWLQGRGLQGFQQQFRAHSAQNPFANFADWFQGQNPYAQYMNQMNPWSSNYMRLARPTRFMSR